MAQGVTPRETRAFAIEGQERWLGELNYGRNVPRI